jgi:DNA invertase Pin-like site-specific DNA recombinase
MGDRVSGMDIYAAVYKRQSSKRVNGSEASTATQHEKGTEEARKRGAIRITYYEDLDRSAYKVHVVRKDFERMIADCRAGRINMIVVHYMSRFSRRHPLDALPLIQELLNLGVTIVSVTEGEFRLDNIMDLFNLIFRLEAAYRESANKSEAVMTAKMKAKALGGYVGGTGPFGFALVAETRYDENGKPIVVQLPVIDHDEADVIRDAWARIQRHMSVPFTPGKTHPGSLSGIAVQFNDEGVRTRGQRTGKERAESRWGVDTLKRILMDPRIAGMQAEPVYTYDDDDETAVEVEIETGKPGKRETRKVKRYRILRDADTTEPLHWSDPIIPVDEWWELQGWLSKRGRGRGRERRASLLTGLRSADDDRPILTCECGRPMGVLNSNSTTSLPSYRCTRPRGGEYPGQHTGGNTVVQQYLDEYLARRVFALISTGEDDVETGDVLAEAARRFGRANEAPETAGERAALLAERADAVDALTNLAESLVRARTGIVRRRLEQEEAKAADRLAAAEHRLSVLDDAATPRLPIGEWLPEDTDTDPIGPGSWWHSADLDDRREFLTFFIDNVTIVKSTKRGGHRWVTYDTEKRVRLAWAQARDIEGYEESAA